MIPRCFRGRGNFTSSSCMASWSTHFTPKQGALHMCAVIQRFTHSVKRSRTARAAKPCGIACRHYLWGQNSECHISSLWHGGVMPHQADAHKWPPDKQLPHLPRVCLTTLDGQPAVVTRCWACARRCRLWARCGAGRRSCGGRPLRPRRALTRRCTRARRTWCAPRRCCCRGCPRARAGCSGLSTARTPPAHSATSRSAPASQCFICSLPGP